MKLRLPIERKVSGWDTGWIELELPDDATPQQIDQAFDDAKVKADQDTGVVTDLKDADMHSDLEISSWDWAEEVYQELIDGEWLVCGE